MTVLRDCFDCSVTLVCDTLPVTMFPPTTRCVHNRHVLFSLSCTEVTLLKQLVVKVLKLKFGWTLW